MNMLNTWLLMQVASKKITADAIEWLPHQMPEQRLKGFRDQARWGDTVKLYCLLGLNPFYI